MQLAFAKKSLRELCEGEAKAQRELGEKIAAKLKCRLADLRAAAHVKELVAGQPCELDGFRDPRMGVVLCGGSRLVFCPNHRKVPLLSSGGVDWSSVSRVKILSVEIDYV